MKKFLIVGLVLLFLSGCISLAVVGHSGGTLKGMSHRVDKVISAHQLPDKNVVIFVSGRLTDKEEYAEFSLLVRHEEIQKIKESRDAPFLGRYKADIGPPSTYKQSDWREITVVNVASREEVEWINNVPLETPPKIYIRTLGDDKQTEGIAKRDGKVEIYYVEPSLTMHPNSPKLKLTIIPNAEEILTKRNYLWLPVTVPLDVATLPAQAIWGALFGISVVGEGVGYSLRNSNHNRTKGAKELKGSN